MLRHAGTRPIETARLLLRRHEMADAEDMFRNWVADPAVSRFWGWAPHRDIGETRAALAGWIAAYEDPATYHWTIVLKAEAARVVSRHHTDNPASGQVLRKCGMRQTGAGYRRVADCEEISGVYCEYGMTAKEWEACR